MYVKNILMSKKRLNSPLCFVAALPIPVRVSVSKRGGKLLKLCLVCNGFLTFHKYFAL